MYVEIGANVNIKPNFERLLIFTFCIFLFFYPLIHLPKLFIITFWAVPLLFTQKKKNFLLLISFPHTLINPKAIKI